MAEVVAAIDCGSNSTRLLVVRGAEVVAREVAITRLSEGVDASGTLRERAIVRTLAVLERYRAICDGAGVKRGLLVATSAVRDAVNGAQFLERARAVSDLDARTLSGHEEAALSYAGATADLASRAGPTAIVDVGGGSTELALEWRGALISYSMQLGCVRVSERALGRERVDAARVTAARRMIDEELDAAFEAAPAFARATGDLRLVGLAGTVATLAQLDAGVKEYSRAALHHRELSRACVQRWRDRLGDETPQQRLAHPGMVPGREDVLVAGLFVLDAVMDRFGVDEVLFSESDILDGIVSSLTAS